MPRPRKPASPFRYFNSSPEVIRLVVMMYVRFPLSLRNVEDLLFERGIDICHETVRLWWNRFGPMFAGDIRRQRVSRMRGFRHWRWHLDEMYVKINGEMRLPLASGRSRGRGPRELRHQDARQGRSAQLHEEGAEAPRLTRGDHHRRPALLQGSDERARQRREAGGRPLGQQPGGELATCRSDDESGRCCRFRRMKSLQKFASVHANVHNHFNLERHLVDRQTYKERRSAALAEWQSLSA